MVTSASPSCPNPNAAMTGIVSRRGLLELDVISTLFAVPRWVTMPSRAIKNQNALQIRGRV
jgi:hypothetical protein